MRTGFRSFINISAGIFTILCTVVAPLIPPPEQAAALPDCTSASSGEKILQFTSGGHVLGFSPGCVIIASADHMLKTDFIDSRVTAPEADAGTPAAKSADTASTLSRVTYHNVWDGVTVVYEAKPGSIVESTYYIDGTDNRASAERIRLRYNHPLSVDEKGNLVIACESGTMIESAPIGWQEIDGRRKAVTVAYALYNERVVGFSLGNYLPGVQVVIDPDLTWNTFLGSSGNNSGSAIAVDGSGNIYIAGYSNATWGSPVRAYTSGMDAFAAKLDSSGNLIWNSFMGGSGDEYGLGVAIDSSGNIYVAGYSNATWGSPVRAYTSGLDGFAAKLDSSGNLIWNTFLGGSADEDVAHAIAVDASGNAYICGNSHATWGSPVRAFAGGAGDAWAARLDSSGNIIWNTFLGGSGEDGGSSIALDGNGNIYVAGVAGATWGSPVRPFAGYFDGFVAKLDSSGNLIWNTFLGSSGEDGISAIALDGSGNVYVAGNSYSTWGSPVRALAADRDAFAAKLDNSGNLIWNTFLGGSGTDGAYAIAVDSSANVYVAGYSTSTWGSPVRAFTADYDAFTAALDSSGGLTWNTFLGGSGVDDGKDIVVDSRGNVYLVGTSSSSWGSPVQAFAGGSDASVAKLTQSSSDATLSSLAVSQGTLTPPFSPGTTNYSDNVTNSVASITITPTVKESHATLTVNGQAVTSGQASQSISLIVGDNPITIEVTAQDGITTDTYIVTATRQPSSDATLGNLVVSQGTLTPAFSPGTTDYADNVTNSVASITVTPTVNESNATAAVNGQAVTSGQVSQLINLSVGDNPITIETLAQDGITTDTYTVTVTRQPSNPLSGINIRPAALRIAVEGKLYKQPFAATGGAAPYAFTENGALPGGITFGNGILSGVPKITGSFPITVNATDSKNLTGGRSYILTVNAPIIIVRPETLRDATAGKYYRQAFTAGGGASPYSFTVQGALPDGMTFVKSVLSGAPKVTGSFPITITAADANNFTGSRSYTLTVNAPTITIRPDTLRTATEGKPYNQNFIAAGGSAPYIFSETGALPEGMTLSKAILSGRPKVAGSFPITIIATDANNFTGSRSYTLTVLQH